MPGLLQYLVDQELAVDGLGHGAANRGGAIGALLNTHLDGAGLTHVLRASGARIGIASSLRPAMHPHGTWGTVGAAVAVARLAGAPGGVLATRPLFR